MNERQKKKIFKKNMVKLRKIHPNEGDIVVFQFDPGNEYIDINTISEYCRAWKRAGIFDECEAAIVPCNVKVLDKESAQILCDKLQEQIDRIK